MSTDKQNWFKRHKLWTAIIGLIILGAIISAASGGNNSTSNNSKTSNTSPAPTPQATPPPPPQAPPKRQVTGKAVVLGAGTFTGGKDVVVGLYNVTTGPGQSGNFTVSGTNEYNEILGTDSSLGEVPMIRVQISDGDKIDISSLSSVRFTPVTTPFVTAHKLTVLYAGTFTVNQDIGAGRYVVTPGAGQSGNFVVSGSDTYNEILGSDKSLGEVPSLTVDLSDGDTISLSSLSKVTFTPSN